MCNDRNRVRGALWVPALIGLAGLLSTSCGESNIVAERPWAIHSESISKKGIDLAFALEPAGQPCEEGALTQGDKVRISFRVSDQVASEGLSGLHIGAWLVPRPLAAARPPDEEGTRKVIRRLLSAKLGAGASTNLNAYFFVTLNTDKTLAMMDPLLDFNATRMKSILDLPAQGEDLEFGADDQNLFVTLPELGKVAVIDPASLSITKTLPAGNHPRSIVRQPNSGYLWIDDDAGGQVTVLDGYSGTLAGTVKLAPGKKLFAFDSEGRAAFVCDEQSGRISRIDTLDLSVVPLADLGAKVSGLTFSSAGQSLYVCIEASGRIEIIDPDSGMRRSAPSVPPKSGPLWCTDDGRWIFVAERDGDRVHVIDTATDQPARAFETGRMPVQVTFTDGFAYVYCAGSKNLTLIQLSALADTGSVPKLVIPITQQNPTTLDPNPIGNLIVPTPENMSVLIAAPEEQRIYYYAEGMMAPRGSYQNYSRVPVAIGVFDRSLRDSGNGIYSTVLPMPYSGIVDCFVYLDQPTQMFGHFELRVKSDPKSLDMARRKIPRAVPKPVTPTTTLLLDEKSEYRFRLVDPNTKVPIAGLTDVRTLAHAKLGNWQQRAPASAMGDGTYMVPLQIDSIGKFQLQVQCPSMNLSYSTHRPLEITVTDDVEAPEKPQTKPGND